MIWSPMSRIKNRRAQLSLLGGLLLSITLISTVLSAPAVPQVPETIIRCDPVNKVATLGVQFQLDIYIQDVENLSGADVQFTYDPSIVTAVDANPGAGGVQMELLDEFLYPDFVLRNIINPSLGTIWYAAVQLNTAGNPRDPANGSGPLARLTFEPLQPGEFEMPITYAKLSTPEGFSIPYTAVNCSITVVEGVGNQVNFLPVMRAP